MGWEVSVVEIWAAATQVEEVSEMDERSAERHDAIIREMDRTADERRQVATAEAAEQGRMERDEEKALRDLGHGMKSIETGFEYGELRREIEQDDAAQLAAVERKLR
jgi:hypothetical protein